MILGHFVIMSKARVIGNDGQIIDGDFEAYGKLLNQSISSHPFITDMKTFKQLLNGKALENRRNIIVDGQIAAEDDMRQVKIQRDYEVAHTLEEALDSCAKAPHAYIIGGSHFLIKTFSKVKIISLIITNQPCIGNLHYPEITEAFKLVDYNANSEFSKFTFSRV